MSVPRRLRLHFSSRRRSQADGTGWAQRYSTIGRTDSLEHGILGKKEREEGPPRPDVCRGGPGGGGDEHELRRYEGIGNSRDRSRRRILRFLRASLIWA